jgi:hypothetical protein
MKQTEQEYTVVMADITDRASLIEKVNTKLAEGWSLQGGVSIAVGEHTLVLAQALTKTVKIDK